MLPCNLIKHILREVLIEFDEESFDEESSDEESSEDRIFNLRAILLDEEERVLNEAVWLLLKNVMEAERQRKAEEEKEAAAADMREGENTEQSSMTAILRACMQISLGSPCPSICFCWKFLN